MPEQQKQLDIESIRDRRPARRIIEIPEQVMQALSEGFVSTMNLVEWLASDRKRLLASILERIDLKFNAEAQQLWTAELTSQSALKQSFAIGRWLATRVEVGGDAWRLLSTHPSDIVREWSAIVVGLADDLTFARKLAWIKPFADDEHSGLREIAWLALRADVIRNPVHAIKCLVPWTGSRNERLRRYASEITRPRGVWTSHIQQLKEQPELGLPILEPLLADDSKYVRNSVGNWLNDASKSQPEWVQATTNRWLAESPSLHTQAIAKRALRSLKKP
jgi:3-methyladenine DNA glycosylase AlkC